MEHYHSNKRMADQTSLINMTAAAANANEDSAQSSNDVTNLYSDTTPNDATGAAAIPATTAGALSFDDEHGELHCDNCFVWRPDAWALGVAIIVISYAIEALVMPWCRPFLWTDADIANEHKENTFPDYSLVVIVFGTAISLWAAVYFRPQCRTILAAVDKYLKNDNNSNARAGGPSRERLEQQLLRGEIVSVLLFFLHAAAFSFLMTSPLKVFDGRLRPDFLSRLRSLGYGPANTTDYCALTKTETLVHHGRLSFPSGHASNTFYTATAATLFFLSRLRAFSSRSFIRVLLGICPMLLAFFVASTRTRDNRHHHSDILAGAVIGFLGAIFSFNLHFAKVDDLNLKHALLEKGGMLLPPHLVGDHVPRWVMTALRNQKYLN